MEAKRKYSFQPDYAVPPGQTLQEVMESLNMSQKELAVRTGLSVQSLNRIFKGEQPITYETANRLELATGVAASFWNKLEAQYRDQLAKINERERLERDLAWLDSIPTKELMERGFLKARGDKIELLREVLGFYGVSSVAAWRDIWEVPAVAARRSKCFESRPGSASAWIRQGELQAHTIPCKEYSKTDFQTALFSIRGITREKPETFVPKMRELCANAGVALALVPEMQKVPWNGATKWLSARKAMILLCLRGKGEDKFWFSFFHEAGHVLYDNKKDLLINDESQDDPREIRANTFAANFLVPVQYDDSVRGIRSKADVMSLANRIGVSAGIVAGRYQFLTHKWHFFRNLIRSFEWKKTTGQSNASC
jgi:addiction module HigA family antidote